MSVYADTSVLVSYYVKDSNSPGARAVIHAATGPLLFTGLHRLEMKNAMALGVFRRILTPDRVSASWSDLERDLRSRRLVPEPVKWSPVYRAAAKWAAIHSPITGCRSLDILHVSLAKKLNVAEFFTFDARQKSLALALGLTVKP